MAETMLMQNHFTRLKFLGLACFLAFMLVFAFLLGLNKTTALAYLQTDFTVTTTNNSGPGSLQEAILSANANPGEDQIVFDLPGCAPTSPCVISLLNPLPVITDALTITGTGMTSLIIDANNNFRGFNAETVPVTIADLTVQNGNTTGRGAGIRSFGDLTLTRVRLLNNYAGEEGGGVYAVGQLTIRDGYLAQNVSLNEGGGLYAETSLLLDSTEFFSNTTTYHGGGAYGNGEIWITGGRFERNRSGNAYDGGGLYAADVVTLTGTIFFSNTVGSSGRGGGLYASGHVWASEAWFENNESGNGGGLYADSDLTLVNSTFLRNTSHSDNGGGAYGGGEVWVTGGRFEQNSCVGDGGGLFGGGSLTSSVVVTGTVFLSNTAESAGSGGGLFTYGSASVSQTYFENNRSDNNGGGLYVSGDLMVAATTFLMNTAENGYGGGLFANEETLISQTWFESNTSLEDGGGLYGAGDLELTNTTFLHNTASGHGGGVRGKGSIRIITSSFTGNVAQGGSGGGVSVPALVFAQPLGKVEAGGGWSLAVTHTQFISNTAFLYGGGIYHGAGDGLIVNTLFARNAAGTQAAAFALDSPGEVTMKHATLVGDAQTPTAGIGITTGTLLLDNSIITQFDTGILNLNGVLNQDYNLFYQNGTDIDGDSNGGAHNVDGDPAFVAPDTDDFHLSAGSAALDVGTDAGVLVDFENQPRPLGSGFDIGFDEADLITGLTIIYSPNPTVTVQSTATFTATVTGGSDVTYAWDFGDGTPGETGTPVPHEYTAPGVYTVTLTAANSSGSVSTSVEVIVVAGKIYLPVVMR